ncbi:MAG: hypothetical protein RLZZ369_2512 [Pseudomonadota bacterium]
MIRIDALWLATAPIDMRMGTERLLAQVVQVFGAAQAHHGYLFANARGNRMKLLLHDGFGMWCAARRLNQGGFEWPGSGADMATSITLTKLESAGANAVYYAPVRTVTWQAWQSNWRLP